ncbi:stemmadenine O-acetyltransferase-like [Solanum dulcamara]|uniref:stemmadenine O-acetyltransferase-like n=1 Tax=Solanum dulcamara TaxID=45834 RepID=UPI002485D7FC|nr:stemmadenine O-acetyltransferase-like [Solanum dulcamara]
MLNLVTSMCKNKLYSHLTCSRKKMKIAKICEVVIKPSSPTPIELREHKISFIDEIIPHSSIPIILFYKRSETITQSQICSHLKTSLSQTLTQFYPLAGRMKSQYSIDCNDEGAYYQESQVDASLLDIIKNPKSNELVQLTPYNSDGTSLNFQELLAIQVNLFNCGGIAISISISHKLGDASSLCTFIKYWCNASEGLISNTCCMDSSEMLLHTSQTFQKYTTLSDMHPPTFLKSPNNTGANKVRKDSIFVSLSSIFPPRETADDMPKENCIPIHPVAEKLEVKRFIFTNSNITKMKDKLINWGYNENATSVEVIIALLWKCFMAAKRCNSVAIVPVNIRHRIVPPLDENSFGNFFLITSSIASVENEWISLVGKIKCAIGRIDGNYVEKIRGEDGFEFVNNNFNEVGKFITSQEDDIRVLRISSWCKFPIYEANFGWGQSILTIIAILGVKDNIVLLDSIEFPGGIEAWVVMADQEMTLLEQDKQLQDFTSVDATCDLN